MRSHETKLSVNTGGQPRPGPERRGGWRFKTGSFRILRSAVLAGAAVAASMFCLLAFLGPREIVPTRFKFDRDAAWITTSAQHEATGCFRLDIDIPSKIAHAWLALAVNGGFELTANGSGSVRNFVFTPTHSFQNGLNVVGQKLQTGTEAIAIVYPREYQWVPHDYVELPTWADLTASLHPGHNIICVEVETSTTRPLLIASGEIQLANGEKIPIHSGANWVAEPVPPRAPQYSWIDPLVPVRDWHHAIPVTSSKPMWRVIPNESFRDAFFGQRVRSVVPGSITWLEQDVDVIGRPKDAYLRVATDTPYRIWINDQALQTANVPYGIQNYGPWFVRQRVPAPLETLIEIQPEWLQQNEVATLLPGQQPTQPTLIATQSPTLIGSPLNVNPLNSSAPGNNYLSDQQSSSTGVPNSPQYQNVLPLNILPQGSQPSPEHNQYANVQNPDRIVAPELGRDRRLVEYVGYGITPLLHVGHNRVKIALYKDQPETVWLSRQPFFAFDGAYVAGERKGEFASGEQTQILVTDPNGGESQYRAADSDGAVDPSTLPAMNYLGTIYPPRAWFLSASVFFVVASVMFYLVAAEVPPIASLLRRMQPTSVIVAGWILTALLVRASMMERSEAIYWRFPVTYLLVLAAALIAGSIPFLFRGRALRERYAGEAANKPLPAGSAAETRTLSWLRRWSKRANAATEFARTRRQPTWLWPALLTFGLALCFGLRAWQIDLQPTDQDEGVSIQASIAIAHTGIPAFQDEVWYTRSPAFHYLSGLVAFLTHDSVYAMRLLTVFFACATGFLLWKLTERFTGSKWWAFVALLLFDIHPYLIFTAHIVRFYQQQQFFHLLAIYFFVRGFVQNSSMRDRYLALLMFFIAVFSQEITLLGVLPLLICYLLFAQRRPWPDEIRFLIVGGCGLAVIALDLAFFQLKCLTALDGISARLDATIGWCFDKPTNFLAIFVGYSRLHLVFSLFLIPGLISAARRRQRDWLCLYIYFFLSIVVINILITAKGFRYDYYLIALWILLCLHGIKELAAWLVPGSQRAPFRYAFAGGCLAAVLASWSPWRIPGSYELSLQANPIAALRFVAGNERPGDKLAITELHPQTALLEDRPPDYDLATPTYYDYVYRKHGKLIDRNGGAQLVGNIDALQRIFAQNERVWIVYNREPDTIRWKDIFWNYPAARLQLYLRQNTRLVFRSYLWNVYLWDRNDGHYIQFREQPGNWFD